MPDYTRYDFNESKELSKNRLVLEVVCKYVNEHQNISYEELKKVFPDNFGKSNLGIIKNEDEIIEWEKDGRTETRERRFFSDINEITSFNNQKLYVSSQWGGERFDRFLNYAKNELGYNIEKSNDTLILDEFYNEKNKKQDIQTTKNTKIKNIMFYGAPGVGKTFSYKKLISLIEGRDFDESEIFDFVVNNKEDEIEEGSIEELYKKIENEKRVEFVTFHQSYSCEDFIEGFRPNENGNIKLEDGIFKMLCNKALKQKEKNFYIVIDEINRGNISKIFGELITLIEEDKRDNLEVTLPYSKEKFKIPSNLYIIATMNSTDKSIASIDIALRRRFTFLKMQPKSILVKDTDAKELMEKLNVFIKDTRGEDFMLGHSYFMSGLDLEFIKEYKLKPLLEEYFYGDEENYKKALDILGDKNK